MMFDMSTKQRDNYWGGTKTIRSHQEAQNALAMTRARLNSSGNLKFRGRILSEEVVFQALCLWGQAQDVAWLEAQLAPHVARLEVLLAEGEAKKGKKGAAKGDGESGGGTVSYVIEKAKEFLQEPTSSANPAVPTRKGGAKRKNP